MSVGIFIILILFLLFFGVILAKRDFSPASALSVRGASP